MYRIQRDYSKTGLLESFKFERLKIQIADINIRNYNKMGLLETLKLKHLKIQITEDFASRLNMNILKFKYQKL